VWPALVALLLVLFLLGAVAQPSASSVKAAAQEPAVALAIPTGDWPQLQRDPQHTGTSPQQVNPPYRYYWRWNEAPFASRTQPVVADNRLFIGSLNGRMYALDADQDAGGGAPTVLWSRDVGAPIRDTAAVYNGRVYFGAYDGWVHALDAANGNIVWSFLTGGGVAAAPVVDNGVVYIGSTDGLFYALDAVTGQLRWTYNAGAPILTSAALSADGLTVYFGAEDLYAYALRTSDGQRRWRTRLQGQSLAERWPVVVGNTVIYRSQPLRNFHFLLHEGDDVMDQAGAVNPNWATDWAAVRPRIVTHLTNNPDRQTFFALDASTGALRGPAPVLYTYGNGDAPAPPVVKDGTVYLVYRARHGIQTDGGSGHVTTRYDAELGRMDLSTLDITGLTATQPFNYQMRYTSDEPAMISIGGNLLFVDNWERLGALNLQTGALVAVANVADYWPACPPPDGQCPAHAGPMPFFTTWPFPGPQVGEGVTHRPLVIASGRLFWRVVDGGLASIGPATGTQALTLTPVPPAPLPLAGEGDRGEGVRATASLTTYVWSEPLRPVADPPADLVARLNNEVQRIVDTSDHLLPYFLERGFTTNMLFPGDTLYPEEGLAACQPGNIYWFDPGELVYTLSMAYPYLSSNLQTQVRSYLSAEMARYPPLEALPWPPVWLTQGTARELYAASFRPNCWPPPDPPLSTLYALWAYARYTGDWAYVQSRWSQIDALFDRKKGSVDSYAAISGAIGYARIAQHLGRTADAAEGAQVAVQGMTAGLNFNSFVTTANRRYPDPRGQQTGWRAPVFFGLVPEVGRYISDTNRSAALTYLYDLTDADGVFLWYITRLGLQGEIGESSFHGPDLAWSVFLAKAYVEGMGRPALRGYLDRPWGLGDLYYLQKLIATIEASGVGDTTPPVITNVAVESVTFYSASVRWETDEPASSQVEYGPTAGYGFLTPQQWGGVTQHWVFVTGLRPDSLYHFRACSTSAGGRSCSGDGTFTTSPGYSLFLPVVLRRR
jgi:outer membrane protein assembly factor BamB